MSKIGVGANFPPQRPNFWFKLITYLVITIVVVPSAALFMCVFNRTTIRGRKHLRSTGRPLILMSNHVTLLDDLWLDTITFFPKGYLGYAWIPYHSPEERNFYKVGIIAWFMRQVKSIPLQRGKGIFQEGVSRLIYAVKEGGLLRIYPEGTRTRTGDLLAPKIGVGRIVYESGAPVLPMYHRGLERILPIGAGVPRFFKHVYASIGEPLYFDEERKLPNTPDTWRLIVNRIMDGIREEKTKLEAEFGHQLARHNLLPSKPLPSSDSDQSIPPEEI
jgi:1-acyl-sn-glycerol-3-phosphate acyltransferase